MSSRFLFMDYLILALTVWRLTSLLVREDGPYEIFARLRVALGIVREEYGSYATTEIGKALSCFWCASVWVAIVVYTLYLFVPMGFFVPFALSAAAILLNELGDHRATN